MRLNSLALHGRVAVESILQKGVPLVTWEMLRKRILSVIVVSAGYESVAARGYVAGMKGVLGGCSETPSKSSRTSGRLFLIPTKIPG